MNDDKHWCFNDYVASTLRRLEDKIDAGLLKLNAIIKKGDKIMATQEEFNAILSQIDSETTRVANTVQALVDQLAAGGMSADAEAQVKADLEAQLAKLRGIGADPANPVP